MSIYDHFLISIMFTKPDLYHKHKKETKPISRLIKHLHTCKSPIYLTIRIEILQECYNKKEAISKNWEDKVDLLWKLIVL